MSKIERADDGRRGSVKGLGKEGAVYGSANPLGKRAGAAYKPSGPGAAGASPAFTQGASVGKTIGATAGRRSLAMPKLPKPGV